MGSRMMYPTMRQLILRWRLLPAIVCLTVPPTVALSQPTGTSPEARSKPLLRPLAASTATINAISDELELLERQAPPLVAPGWGPPDRARATGRRIAHASDPSRELTRCKQEEPFGATLERLALPANQLTYRECHDAAEFYGTLFRHVQGDARIDHGRKAVACLKQYIKLARIREQVWKKLESGGIPVEGNRTDRIGRADQR